LEVEEARKRCQKKEMPPSGRERGGERKNRVTHTQKAAKKSFNSNYT